MQNGVFTPDLEGTDSTKVPFPFMNLPDMHLAMARIRSMVFNNQLEEALEHINQLLERRPHRITYIVTKAEILTTGANFEAADKLLASELEFTPNNFPLSAAYAEALLRNQKTDRNNDSTAIQQPS